MGVDGHAGAEVEQPTTAGIQDSHGFPGLERGYACQGQPMGE
jgi:hypothetical protein